MTVYVIRGVVVSELLKTIVIFKMNFGGKIVDYLSYRYLNDGKSEVMLNQVQELALYEVKKKEMMGQYVFEEWDCDCGAPFSELNTIAGKDRYGLNIQTKICPRCGMLMTNPRMTQDSYNKFYDTEYRKLYVGREVAGETYFEIQYDRGRSIVEFLSKQGVLFDVESVLEIGCSAGGILQYFKDSGKKIKGIDLGSEYINYGISRGLDIECGNSRDLLEKPDRYDLIILHHVLEHFLDINSELAVIKKLLSPKGLLFIAVPGIKSIPDVYNGNALQYLQNAHIRHFTLGTLEQVMKQNGYTCIAGDENIMSIFKYDGDKTQLTSNYYEEVTNALKIYETDFLESFNDELKQCQETSNKLSNIIYVQQQWLNLYRNKKLVKKWLLEHNINKIAIYGMGILGEQLMKELANSDIEVVYVVDKRKLELNSIVSFYPEDKLPKVDAVILTTVSQYAEIENLLRKSNKDIEIYPLSKILREI